MSGDNSSTRSHTEEGNNTAIIELEYDADEPDRLSFAAHFKLISGISEAHIRERGHQDGFCKLIVIIQTTWFVVQLSARWAERLPVTELETMTLAYAVLNVLLYFFWWDKPQGAGHSVRIIRKSVDEEIMDQSSASSASTQSKAGWPLSSWNWLRIILGNGLQAVRKRLLARPYTHRSCKDLLLNGLRAPLRFLWSLLSSVETITQNILGSSPVIGGSTKIGSFERTIELEPDYALDKFIAYGAGVLFGAIHCTAWKHKFPSFVEEVLWKVSSILVTCAPFYLGLVDLITDVQPEESDSWWMSCLMYLFLAAIICYIFARLSLIILPFLELRDLPPDLFKDVQWTSFIPHI